MSKEMDSYDELPEFKIFSRFDKQRDKKIRRQRFQEQIDSLLRKELISESMARNFVELLDINPAYYWPRKYRYTIEQDAGYLNPLTIKERNFFERNGYVVIQNLISNDLTDLVSKCPKNLINEILPLIINQKKLLHKVKAFCGDQAKHIATMIIDRQFSQSFEVQKKELDQNLSDFAKLAQHFYQFNLHPADRLLGCIICVENDHRLSICVEPASHQSSRLEIEMRGLNGELVKKIYEKPIRSLDTLNESIERRKLINLQPGSVFFYHPLLAQSILFEQQTTESEIFHENMTSNLTENSVTQISNHILALNVFYGSADLTKVIRSWGSRYTESAKIRTPIERIKLLDQILEANQILENENRALDENNQTLKEKNELLDQILQEQNDDFKSLNVQIYIGNSIVNLEQVLADAGQESNFAMKSHL